MKRLICLAFFSILCCGCHDSEPEPTPDANAALQHGWKVSRVLLDDVDVTPYYKDMIVTFTAMAYRVEGAIPPVWPQAGTYTVSGKQLKRDDDVTMELAALSDRGLTLRFQYQGVRSRGRVSEVSGQYTFDFVVK